MLKKTLIPTIVACSAIVSLSLLNNERSIAQGNYQSFLQYVYNRSANTCRRYGAQCGSCAEQLTRQIIAENGITNRRVQRDVYNAAMQACY
ncbi:MAG: hypothetical protein AB4372_29065 [Xenococcus sp. (in: cyanobacteria)]